MTEIRSCRGTYKRKLKDGTVVVRERTWKYKTTAGYKPITDETKQKIIELHNLHVPKVHIAKAVDLPVNRITTVIKNHKAKNQLPHQNP